MAQRTRRWVFFSIAILMGLAVGVLIGYVFIPVQYTDTGPQTLRSDYKTDFVLMVSELFQQEGDAAMAVARLAYLGEISPLAVMQTAIAHAQENQYAAMDIQYMLKTASAIQNLLTGTE